MPVNPARVARPWRWSAREPPIPCGWAGRTSAKIGRPPRNCSSPISRSAEVSSGKTSVSRIARLPWIAPATRSPICRIFSPFRLQPCAWGDRWRWHLARGEKGGHRRVSAHYERERRVINLTGSCGAGALCHEWWHAFDHHLATLAGFPDAFASGVESFDTGVAALRQALARLLYDFDAEGKHLPSCFLAKALSLDEGKRKAYFSLAEELSARAFEAGVAAFLKLGGRRNDFLVFGADRLPLYPEQTGALAFFGDVAPSIRKTLAPARQDTAAGR